MPDFLSADQYRWLVDACPQLVLPETHRTLQRTIGTYHSRVLECLPDELHPDFPWREREILLQHSEYVGERAREILDLPDTGKDRELWFFYLSEIMRNHTSHQIWRSRDTERIYSYELRDHGDTMVYCDNAWTEKRWYLSLCQSIYPLIISLLLHVRSFDPEGVNTLWSWNWENALFQYPNPWKRGLKWLIPFDEDGRQHSLGDELYEALPTWIDGLSFSLQNRAACFPILDKTTGTLSFYVSNPDGEVEIGALGKFSAPFILKKEDIEPMFLAVCRLVARDPREVLYGIMRYFPDYYKGVAK